MQTIPVVNLEKFTHSTSKDRAEFIKTIGESLTDIGFFALEGHGISDALISKAYKTAEHFFDLSTAEKLTYEDINLKGQRGYTSFGREHAKDSNAPDLKEFWHVGRDVFQNPERKDLYPHNIWPTEIAEFKNVMLELYQKLENCSFELLKACAIYLGEKEDLLTAMAIDGNSILRVINYPPIPAEKHPSSVRAAAHEDINLITLLCESTAPGLELLQRDGTWRPISAEKGQIVVDTGDMIQNLTNGILRSTTHRVTNPDNSRERRFSMPFFVHPRSEVDLSPLKSCLAKKAKKNYPDITAGVFLHQRLKEIGLI